MLPLDMFIATKSSVGLNSRDETSILCTELLAKKKLKKWVTVKKK
jgi:hypothetical protein